MTRYSLVAGWTSPIDIDLLSKGATPSGTMAGMSVELLLKEKDTDTVINTTGDVTIQDASLWIVRVTPDPADFVPGLFRGRFKVTDGFGNVSYFPSAEWDLWEIRSET